MKVVLLVALSLLALVAASSNNERELQTLFTKFMIQYEKKYEASQFFQKFETFKANLRVIREHNAGNYSFTMGVTEFSDMTFEEFVSTRTGYVHREGNFLRSQNQPAKLFRGAASEAIDWRDKAVTKVKNQGHCGSCWSFSATGAIEGAYALTKRGRLVDLSEQQMVDCAGKYGCNGCSGGLMDYAFEYVKDHGLCADAEYPYKAVEGSCADTSCHVVTKVSGFKDVPQNDEDALLEALQQGPVSVAIAVNANFQQYTGGLFEKQCGTQLNHGVLLVGAGIDAGSGKKFWIVKNSWGNWGENGYIRMLRGINQCGIAMAASYPLVPETF